MHAFILLWFLFFFFCGNYKTDFHLNLLNILNSFVLDLSKSKQKFFSTLKNTSKPSNLCASYTTDIHVKSRNHAQFIIYKDTCIPGIKNTIVKQIHFILALSTRAQTTLTGNIQMMGIKGTVTLTQTSQGQPITVTTALTGLSQSCAMELREVRTLYDGSSNMCSTSRLGAQ